MGKIELDHTGSGGGITLSSDGTDLLLDGTAIGGGGGSPDLFDDNWNGTSTQPSATGENAVAIGFGSVSSGWMGMALGTRAIAYGSGQTTWGMVAFTDSYASGRHSLAGAIASNSSSYGATGTGSVAFGQQSKATSNYATAIGMTCTASGSYSTAIGDNAVASHTNGIAIGDSATTSATNQIALGGTADTVKVSGAYSLPTSDGTNGQVLTTDGSGAVTFADAGGGTPDLYADNYDGTTTQPSATGVNAVAIGTSSNSTGTGALSGPHSNAGGDYSFAAAIGNSTSSYGSQGNNSVAFGQNSLSNGLNSAALGANAQAIGTGSAAVGQSYSSGSYAFAAAINNNTSSYGATGANSVAIGDRAKATAADSFAIGNVATASAAGASVLGGQSSTASGSNSTTIGGGSNVASGDYSTAKGYYGNANGIRLKHATGVYPNQQGAYYVLGYTTSDATAIALNTSVWTPNATNQIVLPNNSAFAFHGTVVAREQAADGTDCAAWKIEGLIRREGSASTTTLVNSATTVLDNTPSWGLALSADTTNGCLKVQATGAAATDIRWVATIHTSEVTYA